MAAAVASTPARRHLARAGWGVVSGSKLPGLPGAAAPASPASNGDQEGKRLVAEVASSWSHKYIFHIRHGGLKQGLYHYECLFSRPTDDKPVPGTVIAVLFAFLPGVGSQAPRLFYQFEEGDLRHEWALAKAGSGWHAAKGQQVLSLKHGDFERYLDTYIREKDTVRVRGIDVRTGFEEPRLKPPPAFVYEQEAPPAQTASSCSRTGVQEDGSFAGSVASNLRTDEASREMAMAMQDALKAANMYCDMVPPPGSLRELLSNVLDAADEDGAGRMSHYEVSRLLMATMPGFGLEEWDIHQLLTYAREDDDGFIESRMLVREAQDVVFSLRTRRQAFKKRGLPGVEIPADSIKHCFSEEVAQTVEDLMRLLESRAAEGQGRALYGASTGMKSMSSKISLRASKELAGEHGGMGDGEQELIALRRRYVRECLQTLHERISPQESRMLMQMLPEDENGFLTITDLAERLEHLRNEALHNSVVACDVKALRTHVVLKFRDVGMDANGKMKVWMIKDALLGADQVCFNRLQIHTLLCLTDPDRLGNVDMAAFSAICSAIIPHMSNAKIFAETAERLIVEHAEAAKERANAELAALGAARVTTEGDGEEEEVEKNVQADQETVERTLIQVFSLADDTRRPTPALAPEAIFGLLFNSSDQQVQGLGLDELEVAGLVGEMQLDVNGEVPYYDFVKRWVPILFELRKNHLLCAYLKPGAAEHLGIPEPDIESLEALFPLLPEGHRQALEDKAAAERKDSKTNSGRQGSKTVRRRTDGMSSNASLESNEVENVMESKLQKGKSAALSAQKLKEPPPGRGYQRRMLQMEQHAAAQAAEKAAAAAGAKAG